MVVHINNPSYEEGGYRRTIMVQGQPRKKMLVGAYLKNQTGEGSKMTTGTQTKTVCTL
jgi:hypothetical protein